jgi:hypothetical protein
MTMLRTTMLVPVLDAEYSLDATQRARVAPLVNLLIVAAIADLELPTFVMACSSTWLACAEVMRGDCAQTTVTSLDAAVVEWAQAPDEVRTAVERVRDRYTGVRRAREVNRG